MIFIMNILEQRYMWNFGQDVCGKYGCEIYSQIQHTRYLSTSNRQGVHRPTTAICIYRARKKMKQLLGICCCTILLVVTASIVFLRNWQAMIFLKFPMCRVKKRFR